MTRNTRIRESGLSGPQRDSLRVGATVDVIQKEDQRSGRRTRGVVDDILTRSVSHPHGIKVRLKGGIIGRVAAVFPDPENDGNG